MTSGPESSTSSGTEDAVDPISVQHMTQALQGLLQHTGYPLVQENGQRRYGPPPGWEGPPPPKGCEVFVGKIPRDLFEDELVPAMEQAGKIYDVRLMMDAPGVNRGYGFVQYSNRQEAEKALLTLNSYEIRPNRYLGVTRSVDNNRLFVGGIPKNLSREEVQEEMKRVTEGVVKIILYPCINDRTKNRGYAFVEYTSHKAAAMARRRLFSGRVQPWGNTEVKVDWAEPELIVDNDTMSKVKILYIRNLALCTTEDDIRRLCNSSNGVERVKKQKDYAFVHFATREQAEVVKASLNGRIVHGCELEITWAKPIKNREEYHQRKAIGRSMVSAGQKPHTFIPHIAPGGEPLIMPHVRRAAGTQGMQHVSSRGVLPRSRTAEVIIPGIPNGISQIHSEKTAEDTRSVTSDYILQHIAANARILPTSQAVRGPPLAPQYFVASPLNMGPLMTPTVATANPQSMAVSPGTFLVPSAPLTGYESLNPYALPAAFYQQALLTQPGIASIDRPRYSASGE
ncbi:probable RNA-binding protein 46 isoform X2 [Panulirus ornatus]|uniref:probable RNA-binding protein 46 isoform X2 n=1 Tax=Panulirus ornatus TaxID=150431 RepID=UPI003A86C4EF